MHFDLMVLDAISLFGATLLGLAGVVVCLVGEWRPAGLVRTLGCCCAALALPVVLGSLITSPDTLLLLLMPGGALAGLLAAIRYGVLSWKHGWPWSRAGAAILLLLGSLGMGLFLALRFVGNLDMA